MTIEFFLPMIPPTVTAQQHEIHVVKGKPYVHDTPELKAAKAKYIAHLGPHAPFDPMTGPLRLTTKWLWPTAGTKHADGEWKTTSPDTDNFIKAFKDSMAKVRFFANDAQVASEITEKFWADVPGIYVRIEELT